MVFTEHVAFDLVSDQSPLDVGNFGSVTQGLTKMVALCTMLGSGDTVDVLARAAKRAHRVAMMDVANMEPEKSDKLLG